MIIDRTVLDEIRRAVETQYPNEGCGLLVGEVGGGVRVAHQLAMTNRRIGDGANAKRYWIAPEDFRAASHAVAAAGLEIVGVYHSHPDAPACPSSYDREHAWPWYRYLIVSVADGTASDVRAWQLRDDRSGFIEHAVRIEN